MVGAILTQNTAWTNVEHAICRLKDAGVLSPSALHRMPLARLAQLIRPAGYFNVKARRLRHFVSYLIGGYGGDLRKMRRQSAARLRKELLAVNGVGPETADSILLYALGKRVFVIDAYTKRIFSRHRIVFSSHRMLSDRNPPLIFSLPYEDWQKLFTDFLPPNLRIFNDFHAQIVRVAKTYCKSQRFLCRDCPMRGYL
jgi:endonuclease-3 related protein